MPRQEFATCSGFSGKISFVAVCSLSLDVAGITDTCGLRQRLSSGIPVLPFNAINLTDVRLYSFLGHSRKLVPLIFAFALAVLKTVISLVSFFNRPVI